MTTTYFEIPLKPVAQTFLVTLGTVLYTMTLYYRTNAEGGWFLDVADSNNNLIVGGIPLVTGTNLLAPFTDKKFPGKLFVTTDGNANAPPTYANLGSASHLYFGAVS